MNSDQIILTPELETYIRDFNAMASLSDATIGKLSPVIEELRKTRLFQYIISDPKNEHAQQCVRSFLDNNSLPPEFLSKLVSVTSAKVIITEDNYGFYTRNFRVKILVERMEQNQPITNLTADARREILAKDISNAITYNASQVPPPATEAVKFTQEMMPAIINCMAALADTIFLGNKQNGYDLDNYIERRVANES